MRSELGYPVMLGSYWSHSGRGRVGSGPGGAGRTTGSAGGPSKQKVPAGNTAGRPAGNTSGSYIQTAGGSTLIILTLIIFTSFFFM